MGTINDLEVFIRSYNLALMIHRISSSFPIEERYSITDQIRRSSRSVCANLKEGYRKRSYIKHFMSKLSDADSENTETQLWLKFSLDFGYLTNEQYNLLINESEVIGRLLGFMIKNPDKFIWQER